MALTTPDNIRDRLQSFDREYYDGLYARSRYLMGETDRVRFSTGVTGENEFPVYPDIVIKGKQIGRSRRLLNAAITALSRVMASEPDPTWPQVDNTLNEARRQWFLARYRAGEWGREMERAFLDGDNLGFGCIQIGARRRSATGEQYTTAVHVPATQVIYDPLEPSLGRSNWVAFVHYVQPERARAMFGRKVRDEDVQTLHTMQDGKTWQYVRVTEYYDLGYGHGYDKGEPTMAAWVGDWREDPAYRQVSPFDRLPCAWFEYVTPPMVRRPIGKIELGLSTAEALNELEIRLRGIVKKGVGFDIVDATRLNHSDLERVRRGEEGVIVRMDNPGEGNPYIRVPDREVASALLQLFSIQERQWNADSQTTDMDRGSQLTQAKTATEAALLDSRSQTQAVHTRREALRLSLRLVERAAMVGALVDRDPVEIDLHGVNVLLNDPADPRLRLDQVFAEPSQVLLSPQSLEAQDTLRDQQMELSRLSALQPLVGQPGGIPLAWFAEKMLRAVGEEDPAAIIAQPMPQVPMAGGGAMPPGMDPAELEAMMADPSQLATPSLPLLS